MNLDLGFLSANGETAVSPLADWATAAAVEREAAARACEQTVGWADASHLSKWELQGPAAAIEELDLLPAVGEGRAASVDGGWWCRPTAERALLLGTGPPTVDPTVQVLDLTAQLAGLRIAGPLARETLARFCALDLRPEAAPPPAFRAGSVARTPGYVVCEAPDRFLVLFGAAYAEYLWEVVSDAGARLGGSPVEPEAIAAPKGVAGHA